MQVRPIERVLEDKIAEYARTWLGVDDPLHELDQGGWRRARGAVRHLLHSRGPFGIMGDELRACQGPLTRAMCERVAEAAYQCAAARGFAPGKELEDWLAAEAQIEAKIEQKVDHLHNHQRQYASIHERIAATAYYLAEQRAFVHGDDQRDWFMAESTIEAELELEEAKETVLAEGLSP